MELIYPAVLGINDFKVKPQNATFKQKYTDIYQKMITVN